MGSVQYVIAFGPYNGGGDAQHGRLPVSDPLSAEVARFHRLRINPPVPRQIGLEEFRYEQTIRNRDGEGYVVIRQFSGSSRKNFQSAKGKARCGVNDANSAVIPTTGVSSRAVGRKPPATESPYGQALPDAVFNRAQRVLKGGDAAGGGDKGQRRPVSQRR